MTEFDKEFNVDPVNFDSFVILPKLKKLFILFEFQIFDTRVFNKAKNLYHLCPPEVQDMIDLSVIENESTKQVLGISGNNPYNPFHDFERINESDLSREELKEIGKVYTYRLGVRIKEELEKSGYLRNIDRVKRGSL